MPTSAEKGEATRLATRRQPPPSPPRAQLHARDAAKTSRVEEVGRHEQLERELRRDLELGQRALVVGVLELVIKVPHDSLEDLARDLRELDLALLSLRELACTRKERGGVSISRRGSSFTSISRQQRKKMGIEKQQKLPPGCRRKKSRRRGSPVV